MTRECLVDECEADSVDPYTFYPTGETGEGRVWLCSSCYQSISVNGVPVPIQTVEKIAEEAGGDRG